MRPRKLTGALITPADGILIGILVDWEAVRALESSEHPRPGHALTIRAQKWADKIDQAINVERLGQKCIAIVLTRLTEGAHEQDGFVVQPRIALNPMRQFNTIHPWQFDVA